MAAVLFAFDVEADGRVFGFVLAFVGAAFGVLAAAAAALASRRRLCGRSFAAACRGAALAAALAFARRARFRFARGFALGDLPVALFRLFRLDLAGRDFLAFEFVQLAGRRQVLAAFFVVSGVFDVFVVQAVRAARAAAAVRAERRDRAGGGRAAGRRADRDHDRQRRDRADRRPPLAPGPGGARPPVLAARARAAPPRRRPCAVRASDSSPPRASISSAVASRSFSPSLSSSSRARPNGEGPWAAKPGDRDEEARRAAPRPPPTAGRAPTSASDLQHRREAERDRARGGAQGDQAPAGDDPAPAPQLARRGQLPPRRSASVPAPARSTTSRGSAASHRHTQSTVPSAMLAEGCGIQ